MRASAEPLEGNKVKLSVEVEEDELRDAVEETFRRLAREVRVPGFRPGKVPRRLLEVRLGARAIREEVIRHALPGYYEKALEQADVEAIAPPTIDVTAGEEGGPLAFDAVVEVRPKVSVAGYEGLVVTLPSPEPTEAEVDAQVDRLRGQFATLEEVDRPAREGDVVTLDVSGTRAGVSVPGLSATDLVYEIGTGGLLPGADERLVGTRPGEIVALSLEDLPEGPAEVRLLVKQVREKVLPAADDRFAEDASEFETLAELRAELRRQLGRVKRLGVRALLEERALEALVQLVTEDPPETLVRAEVERLVRGLAQRLAPQKVSLGEYLAATGKTEEQLLAELEGRAVVQVKADLALRALADAEGIEVSEDELDEQVASLAARSRQSPARLREELARHDGLARLRSEMRNAKAAAWLVEHVQIVDEQGNPMERALLLEDEGAPAADGAADGGASDVAGGPEPAEA